MAISVALIKVFLKRIDSELPDPGLIWVVVPCDPDTKLPLAIESGNILDSGAVSTTPTTPSWITIPCSFELEYGVYYSVLFSGGISHDDADWLYMGYRELLGDNEWDEQIYADVVSYGDGSGDLYPCTIYNEAAGLKLYADEEETQCLLNQDVSVDFVGTINNWSYPDLKMCGNVFALESLLPGKPITPVPAYQATSIKLSYSTISWVSGSP
jgi:hypothetical protein